MLALTHVEDPTAAGFFANQRLLGLDDFGPLQNVDGLPTAEITTHMLASTLDPGNTNYHSTVAVDDLLPLDEGGVSRYLPAWTSMFRRAAVGEPLAGDYNRNGRLDAADHTVWRDTLGAVGLNYAADGNADGVVDKLDRDLWLEAFVEATAGQTISAPEPAAVLVVLVAWSIVCLPEADRRAVQTQ